MSKIVVLAKHFYDFIPQKLMFWFLETEKMILKLELDIVELSFQLLSISYLIPCG